MARHIRVTQGPGKRRRWFTVALTTVAVLTALVLVVWLSSAGRPAAHGIIDTHWPGWGFTHTQFSADDGEPAAVATAEGTVGAVPMVQAQHIMGFGADNPEPSPGVYDFASLDRRMAFIGRTGGVPVLILCCSPDWMKGGAAGSTDWSRLEAAPLPEHFADFAALTAAVAKRYPYVRHFIVWNEFKGFFDDERKRWEAKEYTDLYNSVYDALKAVNPANQVGGPYLDFAQPFDVSHSAPGLRGSWGAVDQRVLDAFVYWKVHRKGADFVAVDGHATTGPGVQNEFAALEKFGAVGTWLRKQVDLPIWWVEWYVQPADPDWSAQHVVALRVAAMIQLAGSGADTVLYWNPRPGGADCVTCLWTDTGNADGGHPLPFLTDVLQRLAVSFPPGSDRRKVSMVNGLLSLESQRNLLIVNTTGAPIAAGVDGRRIELAGYETRWITDLP